MKPINEASACVVTVRYYDANGNPRTPLSARWRLWDKTNSRLVQDWSDIATPSTSNDITIPASLNEIFSDAKSFQDNVVVVQADAGTDQQWTNEVGYRIRNLSSFG